MIVSPTGEIHGRGIDRWRWVSRLSDSERSAVKEGVVVLIADPVQHHRCTDYKQVTYQDGRYGHRNWYGDEPKNRSK